MTPPRVIRLDLAYDGTDFRGFNIQPESRTIQGVLEAAWSQTIGETVRFTPAGRTDTGVHAAGQVVSVRTSCLWSAAQIQRALNASLSDDVAILAAQDDVDGFDARRSARMRHYRYTIWNGTVPHVLQRRFSWHVPQPLDQLRMRLASAQLVGRHDFRFFAARLARSSVQSTWRTVSHAAWSQNDDGFLFFDISADGFLRRMVRGVVGTLVAVGKGRLSLDDVYLRLQGSITSGQADFAPPHGLSLTRVDY
ncbi:MAG: tRNA pseudouridine(38-40) synthase TruA [Chloroflexota bacterium]